MKSVVPVIDMYRARSSKSFNGIPIYKSYVFIMVLTTI